MSSSVRRRAVLTATMALGALPVVQGASTSSASAQTGRALIGPARGHRIHAMSFNVRLPVDEPPHSWEERRPLVASMLRREQPTIIGTQEGFFFQDQEILEDLGESYDWIHLFRRGGSRGEAMAIMYDKDRLKVTAYDHLWLSDTPRLIGSTSWGNDVVRMLTWVEFLDRRTGKRFVHLNTHFDHRSENSRKKSAEMVLRVVREFDLPTIVTGDFNARHETSPPYQILVDDGGLLDTWNSADERLTPEYGTFNSWNPEPVEGDSRIDWILSTQGVHTEKTAINTWAPGGSTPSDHWAVQSLVQL